MELGVSAHAIALVVIPCLNEQSYIEGIVRSILRDPLAQALRIVAIDGGSTDGTLELLQRLARTIPNLDVITNPRRIQSASVNLAAQQFGCGCRWLIRVDAHAEYPEAFVSQLIADAQRTGAASVVVSMRADGKTCFQKAVAIAQNSVLGTGGSPHRRDGTEGLVDHGHHALFDLQTFLALKGYNEFQSHNEDAEFDVRLVRSGGRIFLTRATRITYYPRATIAGLYRQYWSYGRGRALTMIRHGMRPKLRQLIPAGVVPAVGSLTLAPWLRVSALPAVVWVLSSLSLGIVLACRQRSRCALISGFAAGIMHFAWSVGFWVGVFEFLPKKNKVALPAADSVLP